MSESEATEENPHIKPVVDAAKAMAKASLIVTLPAIAVCVALFTVLNGVPGLLGSLVGGALSMVASLSTLGMMRFSAGQDPTFVMVVALGGYAIKVILLFAALTLLKGVTALHPLSLGITMIVAILIAAGAEFAAFKKTKIPTIIPAAK